MAESVQEVRDAGEVVRGILEVVGGIVEERELVDCGPTIACLFDVIVGWWGFREELVKLAGLVGVRRRVAR
jgi:hypothetical protein